MGKVIAPLAEGSVPAHTIFDRRFVVECCERFHLHWRNIRLELTYENWVAFAETMEKAIGTWRANGSPKEHFHLELGKHMMDTQEIVHPTTVGVELCENLYKTMRATHGADADFWEEDAFVHFHYRDMRFEMSIEDFLGFSGTMSAARERLQSILYRPIEQLFETLNEHNILYVVSRNWEALPGSVEVGPHSDLDLLVHPAHVAKLDELWNTTRTQPEPYRVQRKVPVLGPNGEQTFILTDVRTTDDGYMPEEWSHLLLARRVPQHMFYVLPPKDYFLSLLYHVVVHKGVMSDDYARRLAVLAHTAGIEFPIDRVNDLGHHLALLREHGVVPVEPVDVSVLPKMPFIEAPETAISSRILDIHEGRPYHSRVHMLDGVVRKQTTFDLAAREHALLGRLSGPHFPRALATSSGPVWTSCDLELIDGFPLTDEARIAALSAKEAQALVSECLTILDELAAAGITHRDIKADNILVRDGVPVLLDFGWATAPDLPHVTPGGLGNDGKPADGFCDTFAIGRALAGVCKGHPEVLPTLEAMTRPSRSDRITDTTELRALLATKSTKEEIDAAREALEARLAPPAPLASHVPDPVAVDTDVTPVQVLAFATELIADPALLAAYGEAFKPGDPVQLIAYAPDCEPGDIAPALESALEDFTVDAVLLAVPGGKETERTLASTARVLLGSAPSAGPLTELERADGSDAQQLRELAFPAEGGEAPLVSIVIPVFNRVDLTKQCIETIAAVTDTPTYEIIVVDNGSTDGTADFLRSEQVAGRIRCVVNEENLGFGGACNQGAELARGKYVLLLNNDTLPEAGWLKPLVDTMRDTGVGIVGSRLLYPDRTIQHAGIVWSDQGTPTHVNRGVPADSPAVLEQADFSAVTGACLLISRDLFFEVGAFDTEYHMYVEDIDLCLRVWESGHRVVYCPSSVVVHLENASMTDVEWRDRNVVAGWKRLAERWSGRWPSAVRRMAWPTVLSGGPAHPAAIAFADDVLAHPELVGRWSEAFAPGDAMLVIFGPGHEAQTLAGRLRSVLSAYDLEGAGLDVLVLTAPAGAGPDAKLVGALSAVLSSAPVMGALAALPRYDESSVAEFAAQVTGSAIAA